MKGWRIGIKSISTNIYTEYNMTFTRLENAIHRAIHIGFKNLDKS